MLLGVLHFQNRGGIVAWENIFFHCGILGEFRIFICITGGKNERTEDE